MKLKDSYVRTDLFSCVECGISTGPSQDVEDDEEGIPYPPLGWVRLTLSQVIDNPEYLDAKAAREEQLSVQVAALISQAGKVTKEEREQIQSVVDGQIPEVDLEPFITSRVTVALCSEHSKALLDLGIEEEGE